MVCSLEVKMNIYAKSNVICSLFLLYPGLLMISLAVSKNIVFAMLPNESPTNDPISPGNNPPSVFPIQDTERDNGRSLEASDTAPRSA